jgi:hypothetical protein
MPARRSTRSNWRARYRVRQRLRPPDLAASFLLFSRAARAAFHVCHRPLTRLALRTIHPLPKRERESRERRVLHRSSDAAQRVFRAAPQIRGLVLVTPGSRFCSAQFHAALRPGRGPIRLILRSRAERGVSKDRGGPWSRHFSAHSRESGNPVLGPSAGSPLSRGRTETATRQHGGLRLRLAALRAIKTSRFSGVLANTAGRLHH